MIRDEWDELVDRLNVGFPHQQIDEYTTEAWFDTLRAYSREEVGRALARCLGTVEWISCYALVEAIKDEKRERSAVRSTVLPLPGRKTPPPPEWTAIRDVLERSMLLPGHPDHIPGPEARKRIDQLAGYHDARLAEGSTAPRKEATP
jgi:hypothetical protein